MERNRTTSEVRVEQSPARCPYCHDGFEEAELEASVVCQRCLSRHHEDCWNGCCASCQAGRPLALVAAVRPVTTVSPHELRKRWVNRAWLASFLLCMIAGFLGAWLDVPAQQEMPLYVMVTMLLCAVICLPLVAVNTYDAFVRRARDPSTGTLPIAVAALGLCSGGLSSFAYYLRWGWQPLPDAPQPPASRRPGPEKD